MIKNIPLILYGLISYILGFGILVYMVFWVYPWFFMPNSIDSGVVNDSTSFAVLVDVLLIALFGLQHSLMVRPSFKTWFNTVVPEVAQRSTYTLLSAFFLALIIHFWMPIDGYLWYFESGVLFWVLSAVYVIAWTVATLATFQIDHFELFGLHQIWRYLRKLPEPVSQFEEKGFYKFIRHPIQAGTMIGLWSTPQMSVGHLLLAVTFTVYIFIGLHYEERDLAKTLGKAYADYKKRVPMLFPKL